MNNQRYDAAGLNRLIIAVRVQAEQEYLAAIHRDFPDLSPEEEANALAMYRILRARFEQRLIVQSGGKQG